MPVSTSPLPDLRCCGAEQAGRFGRVRREKSRRWPDGDHALQQGHLRDEVEAIGIDH